MGDADLAVTIDEISATPLGASDTLLTIAATVTNSGDAPVAGVLVQFASGALSGLQRLPAVAAGAAVPTSFSFVLPGGAALSPVQEVVVTVDPYDAVAEADKLDNVATLAVDVAALGVEGLEVSVVE
jgi:hypothetical protein